MIWSVLTVVSGPAVIAAASLQGRGSSLPTWVNVLLLAIIAASGIAVIAWIWRNRK